MTTHCCSSCSTIQSVHDRYCGFTIPCLPFKIPECCSFHPVRAKPLQTLQSRGHGTLPNGIYLEAVNAACNTSRNPRPSQHLWMTGCHSCCEGAGSWTSYSNNNNNNKPWEGRETLLKNEANRERDGRLISYKWKGRILIIIEEYQIIPWMTVKSYKEGLMITEMNEKDFNKKSLKTLNHNINTYRVPLVISLQFQG